MTGGSSSGMAIITIKKQLHTLYIEAAYFLLYNCNMRTLFSTATPCMPEIGLLSYVKEIKLTLCFAPPALL